MSALISVVYVNYNSSALTIHSISSLATHCKDVSFEVIIVDNASKVDEKRALDASVKEREWGNVSIIYSSENLGFGKANNLGASNATGKYLFFLNPDTIVCNNVLKIFCEFLQSSSQNTVACGGSLLTVDLKPNSSYGNFPGLLQELGNVGLGLSFVLGSYYKKRVAINSVANLTNPFKVPYIVGANIFISAEAFKTVNGFDQNFFMYYEETDLFYRLSKKGLGSFIVPEGRIIHLEGGVVNTLAPEKFNHFKFEMLLASKLYYYQKWSTSILLPLLKLIFLLQVVVQFSKGRMGDKLKPLLRSYFSIIVKNKENNAAEDRK
ncbi:MAG: glycosyltransferase family 2 protein [Imperialibacter sp.]|uniref:glycosyltransferase family 2 protein n=1 Tax=Imperialibacter sp. TaxID=2038411 RepID=UPI0032EC426A